MFTMVRDLLLHQTTKKSNNQPSVVRLNQPTSNAVRYFHYKYRRSQYFEAKRRGKSLKFPLPVFTIH